MVEVNISLYIQGFSTEKHGCTHYHLKKGTLCVLGLGVLNVCGPIADMRTAETLSENSNLFAKKYVRVKTTCD